MRKINTILLEDKNNAKSCIKNYDLELRITHNTLFPSLYLEQDGLRKTVQIRLYDASIVEGFILFL